MTEFPALKEALVRAAARRRRRRRTVGAAMPAFAAVALLVVFVRPQPERERVVPADPAFAPEYRVFARPQNDADRVLELPGGRYDPNLTRRVSDGVYVLGRRDGWVCVALAHARGLRETCAAPGEPIVTAASRDVRAWLVPDGVSDIRFNYTDGETISAAPQENTLVTRRPDKLLAASWTDADGVRHIDRVRALRFATGRRCDGVFPFEPPPRDAERLAARAALLHAVAFDRTSTSANVIATEPAPSTPCSEAISRRLVQVTLQFDAGRRAVLVGWIKGIAQAFVIPR